MSQMSRAQTARASPLSRGNEKMPRAPSTGSSKAQAKLQQGHVLTFSGWLDSARGCAYSIEGSRTPEHNANQDALLVLEGFAGNSESTLCALMDGHGPQGHLVAQATRTALPCLLARKLPSATSGTQESICGLLSGLGICDDCSERYESSSEGSWCSSDISSPSRSSSTSRSTSTQSPCQLAEASVDSEEWESEPLESSVCQSASSTSSPLDTTEAEDCATINKEESASTSEPDVIPNAAFEDVFATVNGRVRHNPEIYPLCSGSTAVVALVMGNQLTVAHVGDSRCVLGVKGKHGTVEAIQLTIDHMPCEPLERKRVEAEGGEVLALKQEPEVARVFLPGEAFPGLAITRAIGDEILKDYGVVCTPEVMRFMLDDSAEFIVLGSEGLWNVMSNAEAVNIVGQCKDRVQCAERLVMNAKRKWLKQHGPGRVDDITAVVYFLHALEVPL